jgi:hypothetical protein
MPTLSKISHEERVKLTQTMLDVIHVIGEIEDEDVKQTLCQNLIDMCDQLKFRLIINMVKEKNHNKGEIMTGPSSEV